jgi:hypothetical protein
MRRFLESLAVFKRPIRKEKANFEDLGADGKVILKWI